MLSINVTIGEAIDRYIILGLKKAANPGNDAIVQERIFLVDVLLKFRTEHKLHRHILADVLATEQELARVNESLWRHEDAIRAELAGACDFQKVTGIAQAIIKANDRRSKLKASLNSYYGEPASEVKVYAKESECPPPNETPTSK